MIVTREYNNAVDAKDLSKEGMNSDFNVGDLLLYFDLEVEDHPDQDLVIIAFGENEDERVFYYHISEQNLCIDIAKNEYCFPVPKLMGDFIAICNMLDSKLTFRK